MGYDFSFVRLKPTPVSFPFEPAGDFDGRVEAFQSQHALERQVLSSGEFKRNRPSAVGIQWYGWDTPDGGNLSVHVREDWVSIDTHAHWKYVLEVYELLHSIEPELLILDPQTSVFYDATSYRQFVDESYAAKT
jgi:hypothetical protein